jgi:hypothetical protein
MQSVKWKEFPVVLSYNEKTEGAGTMQELKLLFDNT